MPAYPTVDSLAPGHHAFFAYSSDVEETHVLAEFVRQGLERRQRVLYFADHVSPAEISSRLNRRGIDTDRAVDEGRLVLSNAARGTKSRWFEIIEESVAQGYSVMRVGADMSWAARDSGGGEDLAAYEGSIAEVFATKRVIGLCEFDARVFPRRQLDELDALHDVAVDVHPVCKDDEMHVYFTATPRGAAIDGDVDISNREKFFAALETVVQTIDGDLRLDLRNLRFIDIAGLSAIVSITRRLPAGSQLVLFGLQPYLRRIVMLMGWDKTPNLTF